MRTNFLKVARGTFMLMSLVAITAVMAQDAVTVTAPTDGVSAVIDKVTDAVSNHPFIAIGVAVVAEVLGRLVKTEKPLGIVAGIGRLLGSIGALFMAVDRLIGKVLPQRLK